jgi:hypothetical protein
MKQINDQRERIAAKEEERKEKEEKWKHGLKQEKGKKQNLKDALKKKVKYITTCKRKMHFLTMCVKVFVTSHVKTSCSKQSEQCIVVTFFYFCQRKYVVQRTAKLLVTPVTLTLPQMSRSELVKQQMTKSGPHHMSYTIAQHYYDLFSSRFYGKRDMVYYMNFTGVREQDFLFFLGYS